MHDRVALGGRGLDPLHGLRRAADEEGEPSGRDIGRAAADLIQVGNRIVPSSY